MMEVAKIPFGEFIGMGMQSFGQARESRAREHQAEADALALDRRAELEDENIALTLQALERDKMRESSSIIAALAARGIDIGEVSPTSVPLLALAESADEFDRAMRVEQFNSDVRRNDLTHQAGLARFRGKQEQQAGFANTIGGALTGTMRLRRRQREQERIEKLTDFEVDTNQPRGGFLLG